MWAKTCRMRATTGARWLAIIPRQCALIDLDGFQRIWAFALRHHSSGTTPKPRRTFPAQLLAVGSNVRTITIAENTKAMLHDTYPGTATCNKSLPEGFSVMRGTVRLMLGRCCINVSRSPIDLRQLKVPLIWHTGNLPNWFTQMNWCVVFDRLLPRTHKELIRLWCCSARIGPASDQFFVHVYIEVSVSSMQGPRYVKKWYQDLYEGVFFIRDVGSPRRIFVQWILGASWEPVPALHFHHSHAGTDCVSGPVAVTRWHAHAIAKEPREPCSIITWTWACQEGGHCKLALKHCHTPGVHFKMPFHQYRDSCWEGKTVRGISILVRRHFYRYQTTPKNTDTVAVKLTPIWWWSQRTQDVKMTQLLRQNDVAMSFWRYNDFIITACVRWYVACFVGWVL